jgi:hypothetical protein
MKVGDKVKFICNKSDPETGTSLGYVTRFGVEWVLVRWNDGARSIVLESALEVINENR